MKRKSLKEWIKENRETIDRVILSICPNCRLNDEERKIWVLNSENLYLWAKSEGVRI